MNALVILICYISPEGNLSPNTKDCGGTGKVGVSAVGGFVGGVLITAVLGIVIHLLFVRRMRLAHEKLFQTSIHTYTDLVSLTTELE